MNFKSKIEHLDFLKDISAFADKNSVEIFIVGGFVRDLILERKKSEIDFLIIGDGPNFAKLLADELKVEKLNIFKNFGTAHFKYKDYDLEFVGARKESYKRGSRNPDVEIGTFEDDINRRDFTINTLAISLNKNSFGDLVDKFNGFADIQNRSLKLL